MTFSLCGSLGEYRIRTCNCCQSVHHDENPDEAPDTEEEPTVAEEEEEEEATDYDWEEIIPLELPALVDLGAFIEPSDLKRCVLQTFQYDSEGNVRILDQTAPHMREQRVAGRRASEVLPPAMWEWLSNFYTKALKGERYIQLVHWRQRNYLVQCYPITNVYGHPKAGLLVMKPWRRHFAEDTAQNLEDLQLMGPGTPRRQAMSSPGSAPAPELPGTPASHARRLTPEGLGTLVPDQQAWTPQSAPP